MSSFPQSHFNSPEDGPLIQVLKNQFIKENLKGSLPPEELIELGSVYVNSKRAHRSTVVSTNDLIKVRLFPKRYNFNELSFVPRVVFENDDFIVIDKPSPLPTHATADNLKENLLTLLIGQLNKNLYVTSRLDASTEGLIIFGKSLSAQSKINQLFRESKIKKLYRAVSLKSPPPGKHTHYQSPEMSPKREFGLTPKEGWKKCELIILSVKEISQGYLSEIELLTGRTHQIRGQMALLLCPLVGDGIYGDAMTSSFLGLECYQLQIPWQNEWIELTRS